MCLTKKYNRHGLNKIQSGNAKAVSVRAETIKDLVRFKVAKPKTPKDPNLSHLLLSLTPSLGSRCEATRPRVTDYANQSRKFTPRQRPQLQLGLAKVPKPL